MLINTLTSDLKRQSQFLQILYILRRKESENYRLGIKFLVSTFVWLLLPTHCSRIVGYCYTWSHSVKHSHSVRPLWMRDQHDTETSTWQHTTLARDRLVFEPAISASERPQTDALDRAPPISSRVKVIWWNKATENLRECLCKQRNTLNVLWASHPEWKLLRSRYGE